MKTISTLDHKESPFDPTQAFTASSNRTKPSPTNLDQGPERKQEDNPNFSSKLRWSVNVTACVRSGDTVVRTCKSLMESGWRSIEVYFDGPLSDVPDGLKRIEPAIGFTTRPKSTGAYPNFLSAITGAFAKDPLCDFYFFVQDDVVFAKDCRRYIEESLQNRSFHDESIWSLYLSGHDADEIIKRGDTSFGWKPTNRGWGMMGALSVILSRHDVLRFLQNPSTWKHRLDPVRGLRQVDAIIGLFIKQSGKKAMFHYPALAQHFGEESSIYASIRSMSHRRSASTFVGESASALELWKKEDDSPEETPLKAKDPFSFVGPTSLSPLGIATCLTAQSPEFSNGLIIPDDKYASRGGYDFDGYAVFCPTMKTPSKINRGLGDSKTIIALRPLPMPVLSSAKAAGRRLVSVVIDSSSDSLWTIMGEKETNTKVGNRGYESLRSASLVMEPFDGIAPFLNELPIRKRLRGIPESTVWELNSEEEFAIGDKPKIGFFSRNDGSEFAELINALSARNEAQSISLFSRIPPENGTFVSSVRLEPASGGNHEEYVENLLDLNLLFFPDSRVTEIHPLLFFNGVMPVHPHSPALLESDPSVLVMDYQSWLDYLNSDERLPKNESGTLLETLERNRKIMRDRIIPFGVIEREAWT